MLGRHSSKWSPIRRHSCRATSRWHRE
jgi:hypothetical protein